MAECSSEIKEFHHISVLLHEAVDSLLPAPGKIIVDGTIGGAGHSSEILRAIGSEGLLIGIDKDDYALEAADKRLSAIGSNYRLVHSDFYKLDEVLESLGIPAVDGVLLDLGVSSPQLDDEERGFSYWGDAPLDMRMDRTNPLTAEVIVNTYSEEELARIIWEYGEERWAKRIAQFIVKSRPIHTTSQLVEVVHAAVPAAARQGSSHCARRLFQSLRIETNGELSAVEKVIDTGSSVLRSGGRFSVITFHSLEDRIVKQGFLRLQNPCTCPKDYPVCVCGKKPVVKVITRKPIEPSAEELERNPRSRSAKLRVCEKI